jgi:hypothetical protein
MKNSEGLMWAGLLLFLLVFIAIQVRDSAPDLAPQLKPEGIGLAANPGPRYLNFTCEDNC